MLNKSQEEFVELMVELNYRRLIVSMIEDMENHAKEEIERGLMEYGKGFEPMTTYDMNCTYMYDGEFDAERVYEMLPKSIIKALPGKTKKDKIWTLTGYVVKNWSENEPDFEMLYDWFQVACLKEAAAKMTDYSDEEIDKRIIPDIETWFGPIESSEEDENSDLNHSFIFDSEADEKELDEFRKKLQELQNKNK